MFYREWLGQEHLPSNPEPLRLWFPFFSNTEAFKNKRYSLQRKTLAAKVFSLPFTLKTHVRKQCFLWRLFTASALALTSSVTDCPAHCYILLFSQVYLAGLLRFPELLKHTDMQRLAAEHKQCLPNRRWFQAVMNKSARWVADAAWKLKYKYSYILIDMLGFPQVFLLTFSVKKMLCPEVKIG